MKKSEIRISVDLNENNLPTQINWSAEDGKVKNEKAAAFLLSLWDPNQKNTMKIDLWTKDMMVDEMKYYHFQTLMTLADTLERSTGENAIAKKMRDFGMEIGKEMKILTK